MAVRRIELTHFRGFERLDLAFEPDLTALVGVNGCGKSSVLDALALGLGSRDWASYDVGVDARAATVVVETTESMILRAGTLGPDGEVVERSTGGPVGPTGLAIVCNGASTPFAMICEITRRLVLAHPETDDPAKEPFLLIVDGLEQHMHPQWQRELPWRLREAFPRSQMVVSTYSPIVVSELLPRHVRVLDGFRVREGAHREGQDVSGILESVFGTPSRRRATQALIDGIRDALDGGELDEARGKLGELERQLGGDDPQVIRLGTRRRMLEAIGLDSAT